MQDSINLKIPSKAEYISVVRLTASSLANSMGMDIEAIDDIKVSIAEACISAMEDEDDIEIVFNIYKDRMSVCVDRVREDSENLGLGMLIIKSLMDEVEFVQGGISMVKYIEEKLI